MSQPIGWKPQSQRGAYRLGLILLLLALASSATGLYLWRDYQAFSNGVLIKSPGSAGNASKPTGVAATITLELEKGAGLDSA
jgi:hypothetical protein